MDVNTPGGRLKIKPATIDVQHDDADDETGESVIYVEDVGGQLWQLTCDHEKHIEATDAIADIMRWRQSILPGVVWSKL